MKGLLCLAVSLAVYTCCLCQTLMPLDPVLTLPTGNNLPQQAAIFYCGIVGNATDTDYDSTWTTPTGVTVTATEFGVAVPVMNNKYILQIGTMLGFPNFPPQGATFSVMKLLYSDAGNYTCSITFSNGTNATTFTELVLDVFVSILGNDEVASVDAGEVYSVGCEMFGYIREDSDLQWMKDNEMVVGNNRINITVNEGLPGRSQFGGIDLTPSRVSTLTLRNVEESDGGVYTCFVAGANVRDSIQLAVTGTAATSQSTPITSPESTATTVAGTVVSQTSPTTGSRSNLILAVGVIAGILGFIVFVLILLIVVVFLYKRKKSSIVSLDQPQDRDLNENTVYNHTSNGGVLHGGTPKYARIDKTSISPPPPLPARPGTNLSSANSADFNNNSPPGYETPLNAERSVTIDPYYDNPDDVKPAPPLPAVPWKKRTYYDEIEFGDDQPFSPRDEVGYGITTVPSPAVILSGSLQRSTVNHHSPDFTYPPYNEDLHDTSEHDYDQIYSEPLDPTMLNHEYELDSNNDVAIPYSAIYDDPQPLHDSLPLRVTEKNIIELKRLGMGQFGNVILARTIGLSMKDLKFSETDTDTNKSTLVAIKKLKNDADGSLMESFDKEVKFMARLNHDNVVRLLAVCKSSESFIMMEYMENGDLNQFLQKQILMPDTISGLQDNEVTPIILLYMGVQMASGMHYLSSHHFVHRDLATRNCLVGRDFIVKISDFGMSRSLYESAYYRVQGTLILPIRWMACETFYGKFSVKSDAWAFGVSLWEIYTLGKVDPYDTMSDEDVIADAIRGPDRKILEKPRDCPQDVYEIMLRCWVHEPSMRADFGEIYSRLFMIYTRQAL